MAVTRLLGRLALFLIPMAAAAATAPSALEAIGPAYIMAAFLAFGRLAAFASGERGASEALLMAESLPFAAFCAAWGASLGMGETLAWTLAAGAGAAALASLEDLAFPRNRGFALVALFWTLLGALAWLATATGPFGLAAAATVTAGLTRYAASRRRP